VTNQELLHLAEQADGLQSGEDYVLFTLLGLAQFAHLVVEAQREALKAQSQALIWQVNALNDALQHERQAIIDLAAIYGQHPNFEAAIRARNKHE
jgi:hypothetical protein